MNEKDFREIAPNPQKGLYTSVHVQTGIPIPKSQRIRLFDEDTWEEFTEEWASSLELSYHKVRRFAGAGDQGLDVVGYISSSQFSGGWDNYQCKFYDHPLRPSDVWVEFGKIIYYSFIGQYPAPQKYYFVAPQQVGTSLSRLLSDAEKLKEGIKENWAKHCENGITTKQNIKLDGHLLTYFDGFDFTIFEEISVVKMIEQHAMTPHHAVRFGGGLLPRPIPDIPPVDSVSLEHRYVRQLLEVYAESVNEPQKSNDLSLLQKYPSIDKKFQRQRERFYHAESLKNFSRDTVPNGVFEALQVDIYNGVVDVCEGEYRTGVERLTSTLAQAANVVISSSPLESVTRPNDKQGICHQLVNDSKLNWSDDDE